MSTDMPEATCFTAAIVKGLKERGDAYRHFGSLMAFDHHRGVARALGLVSTEPLRLTADGEAYYAAKHLGDMPDGRAYGWGKSHEYWHWPQEPA